jgi:L-ascorbate metabolism protein UlaG (beta-lactamase superfamily)
MNEVYLKPNLVIEPLYDRWYAWSHLISPATAAMNLIGRHLAIMDSYIAAPDVHAQAVLNPKMRGGPFMDLGGGRVDEVKELGEKTRERQSDIINFANAIKELDNRLAEEAKGSALESMYSKVPNILKGFVELYYDRQNIPGFRLYESLLYKSKFYNKDSQSIAIWLTNNDHRPFCLSTPRLESPDVLHLAIPFDSKAIDDLAKMRRVPQELSYIKELLSVPDDKMQLFSTFFTEEKPAPYQKYQGDKIRMRYFGHACILIETKDVSVLLDPLISYYGYHSEVNHFSEMDLPKVIDYVLITHNHQDHILLETLLPLRHRIGKLIVPRTCSGRLEDPDLELMFKAIGFDQVMSIDEMETLTFSDSQITGIPFMGEHADLNIRNKSCYVFNAGSFKLLFLADSRVSEPILYEHIHDAIGDVDVMFMGMECDGAPLTWLYGPLITKKISREQDNSRRLAGSDCQRAMALVNIFNPSETYVYAMGLEPWVEFISSIKYTDESNPIVQSNHLVNQCREKGVIAERLYGEKELLYEKGVPVEVN